MDFLDGCPSRGNSAANRLFTAVWVGVRCALFSYRRFFFFFSHFYFPASGQAVFTGVVPSPPRFLRSIFIAHRVQQSHCSSIFHQVLLTYQVPGNGTTRIRAGPPPLRPTMAEGRYFDMLEIRRQRVIMQCMPYGVQKVLLPQGTGRPASNGMYMFSLRMPLQNARPVHT